MHISKEKMNFAKAALQNINTEIIKIVKAIDRRPQAVYELEDQMARRQMSSFNNRN